MSPYLDIANDIDGTVAWSRLVSRDARVAFCIGGASWIPRSEGPTRRKHRDAGARRASLKCRTGDGVGVERSELTKRQQLVVIHHPGS